MTRITQQFDLYAAEVKAPAGRSFDSQAEIQRWINDTFIDAPWWGERFPRVKYIECPTVDRTGAGGSVGAYFESSWSGVVEMAPDHWRARDVCHEVAHVVAGAEGSTSHCPVFARLYLELVYRAMGEEVWRDLRASFLEAGICFDERCMTKERCCCGG